MELIQRSSRNRAEPYYAGVCIVSAASNCRGQGDAAKLRDCEQKLDRAEQEIEERVHSERHLRKEMGRRRENIQLKQLLEGGGSAGE